MKINFKTLKLKNIKPIRLLKFLPTTTLLALLIIFGLTIIFLYQFFYQTVAQVKVVSILKNQVALNQVNVPLYQKVLNAWESKKQFNSSTLDNIGAPFKPLPEISPTGNSGPSLEEANLTD